MSRLPRRKLGRGVYHVYNRSANNMWILETDAMKDCFMQLVLKYIDRYELNVYHYCVMSNHFHFAIEGDICDISSFMSGVSSRYTMRYHAMTKSGYGSIWQGRYKSVLVQKEGYLARLGKYIELNPVRAQMIQHSDIVHYPWSSAKCYLTGESDGLIRPEEHPYQQHLEQYGEQSKQRYAQYLSMPYEEDMELFRSENRQIGDEAFLASVISIGARKKLSVGRPRKKTL